MKDKAFQKNSTYLGDFNVRAPKITNFLDVNKRRLSLINQKKNSDLTGIFSKKRSCCNFEEPRLFVSETTSDLQDEETMLSSNKWRKKPYKERFPTSLERIKEMKMK